MKSGCLLLDGRSSNIEAYRDVINLCHETLYASVHHSRSTSDNLASDFDSPSSVTPEIELSLTKLSRARERRSLLHLLVFLFLTLMQLENMWLFLIRWWCAWHTPRNMREIISNPLNSLAHFSFSLSHFYNARSSEFFFSLIVKDNFICELIAFFSFTIFSLSLSRNLIWNSHQLCCSALFKFCWCCSVGRRTKLDEVERKIENFSHFKW